MAASLFVFAPTASCQSEPQLSRHALNGLAGKVVGFIDNAKPNFNYLVDDLADLLVKKYRVGTVIRHSKCCPSIPAPETVMKELVQHCDAVISGSGD